MSYVLDHLFKITFPTRVLLQQITATGDLIPLYVPIYIFHPCQPITILVFCFRHLSLISTEQRDERALSLE